jgi:hypothetical protein
MKKLLLILGCIAYSATILATTYTSTASGALNATTGGVWSGNNAPINLVQGDVIVIANNCTITNTTLTTTPMSVTIIVENGSTLNFNSAMTFSLLVNFDIKSGGIFNFNNVSPIFMGISLVTVETGGQLNFNTGATFGTFSQVTINNQGTCYVGGNLDLTSTAITVNGTLQVVGNLTNSGSSTVNGTGSVLVTGSISGGSSLALSAPNNVLNADIWTGGTSTAWNNAGNWSNGIPSTTTDIAIPNVASGKYYPVFNGQTISANVSILAGAEIDVTGNTTIGGNLSIESNATNGTGSVFVSNGALTVSGTTSVQQYLTSGRYWYITSPLQNGTLNAPSSSTWVWNEAAQAYSSGSSSTPGHGFVLKTSSSSPITFTGSPLNFGNVNYNLTYTAGAYSGFSLVGNPYSAYLDWSKVYTANNTITSTISYSISGNFATYNANGGSVTNGASQYIPPMQAIWVHTPSSTTLSILNSYCVSRSAITAINLKSDIVDSSKTVRLRINNGKFADEHLLVINNQAKDTLDPWDSEKRFADVDSFPQIYSIEGNKKLTINAFKSIDSVQTIPVYFTTKYDGTFSIGSPEIKGLDNYTITLYDKALNKIIPLSQVSKYTFTSNKTSDSSRFELKLKADVIQTKTKEIQPSSLGAYANSEGFVIAINGTLSEHNSVIIYNVLGQVVAHTTIFSNKTIVNGNFPLGTYFVRIQNGNTIETKTIEKL